MGDRIFISYRRSGSPKDANMIFDHLVKVFGAERVFMDVDGIDPGDDFVEVLERQLADCGVLLALIGPDWLHAKDEHGQRKLDNDEDFVRVEIRSAIERQLRIVPILLDGTPMPRKQDLPEDLHRLTRRQGLPVDATRLHDFRHAMARLVEVLNKSPEGPVAGQQPVPTTITATQPAQPPVPEPPKSPAQAQTVSPVHRTSARQPWMSDQGDDEYGYWADLTVKGVVQRMRWIEPGEFRMGATEEEQKRFGVSYAHEKPRHRVRLSQGFWLADTACTQALWQTVAGDNPSRFTGDPDLPVEQVSWDAVTQQFLPALARQLGGAAVRLPTEAQWEYACRAGSETAYAFGELITPEQVNYDGSVAPPGGAKGLDRQKTVPVKALPANAWGLYQMHGNVWEWCADAPRSYTAKEMTDPDGGQDGSQRAVRGGSWIAPPGLARSAFRGRWPRVRAHQNQGFRLSLRSPGPEAGGRR